MFKIGIKNFTPYKELIYKVWVVDHISDLS